LAFSHTRQYGYSVRQLTVPLMDVNVLHCQDQAAQGLEVKENV